MAESIGAIQIEVAASPDAGRKAEAAGKDFGKRYADAFVKSLKDKVDKSTDTRLGKTLFGTQTWNVQNQPMGYQGGILSGAANSMSLKTLAILGVIAGGIGVVVGLLAKASPALSKEVGMFESAMKLFFRPFGDMLATLLRPALIWLIKMGMLWNKYLGNPVAKALLDPLAFGAQIGPPLIKALTDQATWDTINSSISGYLSDIGSVISGVWSSLVSYASTTWSDIENFLENPLQGIISWVNTTWSGIEGILKSPLTSFYNWLADSWVGKIAGLTPITPSQPSTSPSSSDNIGVYDFATRGVISSTSMTQADTLASIGLSTPLSERNNQIFGGPNPFGHYAEGGIAWTPQIASLAESEPEAIIPLSKLKGNNITVNTGDISVQVMDKTQIINEVTRKFSMELQRRLAVYG